MPTLIKHLANGKHGTRSLLLLCATAALVSTGCGNQKPVKVAELEVSSAGTYLLAGKPVPAAELKYALKVLRTPDVQVELHILAASNTDFKAVGVAATAAQAAGISLIKFGESKQK